MKKNIGLSGEWVRRYGEYALLFAGVMLILTTVALSVRGRTLTNQLYDTIRTTASRDDVVIVGIDDKSLQEIGAWPWDRSVFADLTKTLASYGVRVAAFDVLFFEPRHGDEAFRKALNEADMVSILASKVEQGEYLSSYMATGTDHILSGVTNVLPDQDGKVRRFGMRYVGEGYCIGSLSQEVANEYLPGTVHDCGSDVYFRYPAKVDVVSLVDVIHKKVPLEVLSGKVVFIGSTSLGLEDHFIGRTGNKVPGVFIHASMFDSIINGIHDQEVPRVIAVLLIVLCSIISASFVFLFRSVGVQALSTVMFLISIPVIAALVFDRGYIFPLPWLIASTVIGSGYAALVRFVTERKQNEQIRQMFSKYVHKDVLEKLMSQGGVKLGGERKELTILFSDIRGFTSLSESLSPEDLTSVLNDYFSVMTPHILEEHGTIDKFIGDAIMAFWNAPLTVRNHELHAVRAALRMHAALERFNTTHDTHLAAGIGIHTGQAVVGNIGGQDRVNYTVLGDTVNLSSRLEGLTKKYGVTILVTEVVRTKIHDDNIAFRFLDTITVVGKSIPTKLYEVRAKEDFEEGTIELYEEAYGYYARGEWGKAESLFKKLQELGDRPGEVMLARIPLLQQKTEWDGVWRFDDK